MNKATLAEHPFRFAGQRDYRYLYLVNSRRLHGLSLGINLNPNNACNWHCVYCDIPGLTRGAAPAADLNLLQAELDDLLALAATGRLPERFPPITSGVLQSITIAGNGEPTSAPNFTDAIGVIIAAASRHGLLQHVKLSLISNGSQIYKPQVQAGLKVWHERDGEIWFKIDSVTPEGIQRINQVNLTANALRKHLKLCGNLCRTRIQTCMFAYAGQPPSETEQQAYLDFLAAAETRAIPLAGILLYGAARPSRQAQASLVTPLPLSWLQAYAERIRALGYTVEVYA